jgi:hypothetical protein
LQWPGENVSTQRPGSLWQAKECVNPTKRVPGFAAKSVAPAHTAEQPSATGGKEVCFAE